MPLGIVSDAEFEAELDNSLILDELDKKDETNNTMTPTLDKEIITSDVLIKNIKRGRGNNTEVPMELRKVIGETSAIEGRAAALAFAGDLGISPSSVSAYARGTTSTTTYNSPNSELKSHIQNRKNKISKKAITRLNLALQNLNEEKLQLASGRELAGIAKDMASIVSDMEDKNAYQGIQNNGPTFIMYSPQLREEKHYDVVSAKDTY